MVSSLTFEGQKFLAAVGDDPYVSIKKKKKKKMRGEKKRKKNQH